MIKIKVRGTKLVQYRTGHTVFSELILAARAHLFGGHILMRLAFAITTSVQPEIIVMDEMIGAGDASFLNKATERLTALLGQTRIVVLASHSQFIVERFCNKALWLEKGQARALGRVAEVLQRYQSGGRRDSCGMNGMR